MMCPECGGKMEVLETREVRDGTIRRRRVCAECGRRCTTYEKEPKKKRFNMENWLDIALRPCNRESDR